MQKSMNQDRKTNTKRILIVVPHEDDEINVAGQAILNFTHRDLECHVLFTTNGDMFGLGDKRKTEAEAAAEQLGLPKENIHILDFKDQCRGKGIHRYHTEEAENWYREIYAFIDSYQPNIIIGVDADAHPDHVATSFLLERAIGEYLKSDGAVLHTVWKGFAYATAYNAKYDYRKLNLRKTLQPFKKTDWNNPLYEWQQRIRIPIVKTDPVYKALECYESQKAIRHAGRIINSDECFWNRRVTSLTYRADISASSGEVKYLNDFRMFEPINIMDRHLRYRSLAWVPDIQDEKKEFKVQFEYPSDIDAIAIYERIEKEEHITLGEIELSNGYRIKADNIDPNGKETILKFPRQEKISYLTFRIVDSVGKHPGISEIEIYPPQEDELLFIKAMINDNFVYDGYITTNKRLRIKVYSCRSVSGSGILSQYDIEKKTTEHNCKIRIVAKENNNIYDEVTVRICSEWEYFLRNSRAEILNLYAEMKNNIIQSMHKYKMYVKSILKLFFK